MASMIATEDISLDSERSVEQLNGITEIEASVMKNPATMDDHQDNIVLCDTQMEKIDFSEKNISSINIDNQHVTEVNSDMEHQTSNEISKETIADEDQQRDNTSMDDVFVSTVGNISEIESQHVDDVYSIEILKETVLQDHPKKDDIVMESVLESSSEKPLEEITSEIPKLDSYILGENQTKEIPEDETINREANSFAHVKVDKSHQHTLTEEIKLEVQDNTNGTVDAAIITSSPNCYGDHDSGVDESTPRKSHNVVVTKTIMSESKLKQPSVHVSNSSTTTRKTLVSPTTASPARSTKSLVPTPSKTSTPTPVPEKKVPMNKVVVGTSAAPNLTVVKSKIGSLQNVKHKAGGGDIKVETKKIDVSTVKSKVGSTDNIQHKPQGGEKKVMTRKLDWKAQSKIGSLENATHKAGGGDKKIETQKLDFKDKAKPKVGSKDNIEHKAGGGTVRIEERKLTFKETAKPKIGSLDNVTHKPGGGTVQIFDEKTYYRQQSSSSKKSSLTGSDGHLSDNQSHSPQPSPNSAISPGLMTDGVIPGQRSSQIGFAN